MKNNKKNKNKTGRKYVNILGINVVSTNKNEVLGAVKDFVADNIKFSITTPNPELVLASTKDSELKMALNSSTFAIPDGIGLAQAAKFLSMKSFKSKLLAPLIYFFQGIIVAIATFIAQKWLTEEINTIKGRVLFNDLVVLANKNRWKVFFLGGETGEAKTSALKLGIKYKNVRIESFQGPMLDNNADPVTDFDGNTYKDAVDRINKFAPQILFVAMKNPKQEKWIYKNLKNLKVGGAMTVGGTFRYISGLSILPPKWMEKYGLEWVFRLITEPYRINRIINAWPIFPIRVYLYKLYKVKKLHNVKRIN